MTIVVFTPPATEPLTVADLLQFLQIDESNFEPAPGVVTAALASPAVAGALTAGAYRYRATFVTASGETQAGEVSAAVTVADPAVNGKIALTGIPIGGSLVTARKLYRTAANGSSYLLLATAANNTATTYTDNIADAALGAGAPTANTTADPMLGMMIAAARAHAETELHRFLITQTLDMYLDAFPQEEGAYFSNLPILLPPIQSVTSISYTNLDGTESTLAADQYLVDTKSQPARITPAWGTVWPPTRMQNNAVKVRFVAGYGAAADVPDCIRHWMLLRIRTMWESRHKFLPGMRAEAMLPDQFIDGLLDSERVTGRIS